MSYIQLLSANPAQQDWAGSCISFVTHSFNIPNLYGSAWDAWSNSIQHSNRDFPESVSHPIWFSHFGTYGEPPEFKNWGHTCVRFNDGRILSSPGSGYGQQWFTSIEQVESWFNCAFVGWSEDVNGVKVIQYDGQAFTGDDMRQISFNGRRYLAGLGAISSIPVGEDAGDRIAGAPLDLGTDFARPDAMNKVCRALGIPDWAWVQVGNGSDIAGQDHSWNAATGFYVTTIGPTTTAIDIEAIKTAVKETIAGVDLNIDAIAQAIADNIKVSCNCGCGIAPPVPGIDETTKAEILSAIEANYPEDK